MPPKQRNDRPRATGTRPPRIREVRRPLATADELCEHFGISINTLYDWRKKGYGPPATKVGRALRFDWNDVEAWEAERKSNAA